ENWVAPLQLAHLIGANLTALKIGPHFGAFWAARFLDAVCVAGIFAAALPVGALIVRRFADATVLFALAIGLWVVAVVVLVLGAFSVHAVPAVLVMAAGWALPAVRSSFRFTGRHRLDGWSKLMLTLIVAAAAVNLLGAVVPPFEYDELEYH